LQEKLAISQCVRKTCNEQSFTESQKYKKEH
jgi:hypothetical protein